MSWVVVKVKTRDIFDAGRNVERQGGELYVPRAMVRSPRTRALRPEALFPGYGFARHPEGRWVFLSSTWGVAGVVGVSARGPALVPDAEVARIRAREGPDGLVRLESREFERGERVRVERGALTLDAVVDGMAARDRIFVLMEILGRATRAEVDVRDVLRDG